MYLFRTTFYHLINTSHHFLPLTGLFYRNYLPSARKKIRPAVPCRTYFSLKSLSFSHIWCLFSSCFTRYCDSNCNIHQKNFSYNKSARKAHCPLFLLYCFASPALPRWRILTMMSQAKAPTKSTIARTCETGTVEPGINS